MNKRTAAILCLPDLVVLRCKFQHKNKRRFPKQLYTYVSREAWLSPSLEEGALLVVEAAHIDNFAIVEFVEWGDPLDLQFEDEEITYKFVLCKLPVHVFARRDSAERTIDELLKAARRQQLDTWRAQARAMLESKDLDKLLEGM